jgi:hypothetical protein
MGVAQYDIVPVGKLWGVQHAGKVNGGIFDQGIRVRICGRGGIPGNSPGTRGSYQRAEQRGQRGRVKGVLARAFLAQKAF